LIPDAGPLIPETIPVGGLPDPRVPAALPVPLQPSAKPVVGPVPGEAAPNVLLAPINTNPEVPPDLPKFPPVAWAWQLAPPPRRRAATVTASPIFVVILRLSTSARSACYVDQP
jgi:hypothetical protein